MSYRINRMIGVSIGIGIGVVVRWLRAATRCDRHDGGAAISTAARPPEMDPVHFRKTIESQNRNIECHLSGKISL